MWKFNLRPRNARGSLACHPSIRQRCNNKNLFQLFHPSSLCICAMYKQHMSFEIYVVEAGNRSSKNFNVQLFDKHLSKNRYLLLNVEGSENGLYKLIYWKVSWYIFIFPFFNPEQVFITHRFQESVRRSLFEEEMNPRRLAYIIAGNRWLRGAFRERNRSSKTVLRTKHYAKLSSLRTRK